MSSDATRIEEHLRAASDAILLLLTEIGQLERHKRGIPPGEPRFDEVSRSIRAAAQGLAEFTEGEEAWARTATDGRTDIETIAQSEAAPNTAEILERWRAVERLHRSHADGEHCLFEAYVDAHVRILEAIAEHPSGRAR